MRADHVTAADRAPRAGRYLIPGDTPRRGELIAACAVLGLLVHLLFAQLTLVLAAVFHLITRTSRWRPQWLAVPAVTGVIWALAAGLGGAWAGFTAGPGRIASYLGGAFGHPGRILHLATAYAGFGHWLPRQLPLALVAASAEAAIAAWLNWLHTDEWKLPPYRSGLVTFCRRAYLTRFISSGGVVTRDGACLGLDATTGWQAAVSWAEVAGGVLCAGAPGSGTTTTSFQLVHAAIRRRKPVIAVDSGASASLARSFSSVCAATRTPLQVFPPAGGNTYYDPLRGGEPARRTSLVMGMIDWTGTPDAHRRSCAAYLTDLFAVLDAAPGDPATAMLDEIAHLLSPAVLRARMSQVPGYHPRRQALAERVQVSARLIEADPRTTATLIEQLSELRASALGRFLVPGPGIRLDLGRVVRERTAVLFSLDEAVHGRAAAAIARLVVHDVLAVCAELRQMGVPGDGLVWLDQCDGIAQAALAELVSRGAAAGLPALLTTTAASRAEPLAEQANVLLVHRLTDPLVAERFAGFTGEKLAPAGGADLMAADSPLRMTAAATAATAGSRSSPAPPEGPRGGEYDPRFGSLSQLGPFGLVRRPVVAAQSLSRLGNGEHVIIVKAPRHRVVTLGLTVPSRTPRLTTKPLPARQNRPPLRAGTDQEGDAARKGRTT